MPGRNARPTATAIDHSHSSAPPPPLYLPDERWIDNAEYLWGIDLYNHGFFWEAHEAWESLWRAAERDALQRRFLQGLIQFAAACLKATMGDAEASRRLAARALTRLERVAAERSARYMGLDVRGFVAELRRFAEAGVVAIERRPWLRLG
jgi:predicted metal-dependent hydrolase